MRLGLAASGSSSGARLLHDEAYLTSDVTLHGVTTGR
jgi:hypothetical protein